MTQLTTANYYDPDRLHISNSKVSDYLKSKKFYFEKHVAKIVPRHITAAMRIGSIVDSILTGSHLSFEVRTLKREDPDLYARQQEQDPSCFCSQHEMDEAILLARHVQQQPCFDWYHKNDTRFQYVLEASLQTSVGCISICGMADMITETEHTVYIDDLKCTNAQKTKSPIKWLYNCLDMGYLRQLAAYGFMWQEMHPDDKRDIKFRHLTVAKIEDSLYKIALFEIHPTLLVEPLQEFLDTVERIARSHKQADWCDSPVDWAQCELLGTPNDFTSDSHV